MSTGMIGYNTVVEYDDAIPFVTAAGTIGQVQTISGIGGEADRVEITNNDSPSGYKEFLAGLIDPGEIELGLVIPKGGSELVAYLALLRTEYGWRISLPDGDNPGTPADGSIITFPGIFAALPIEAETQSEYRATAKIIVTGAIAITADT